MIEGIMHMYSVEIVIKYATLTSTTICNFTFDVMFQGDLLVKYQTMYFM